MYWETVDIYLGARPRSLTCAPKKRSLAHLKPYRHLRSLAHLKNISYSTTVAPTHTFGLGFRGCGVLGWAHDSIPAAWTRECSLLSHLRLAESHLHLRWTRNSKDIADIGRSGVASCGDHDQQATTAPRRTAKAAMLHSLHPRGRLRLISRMMIKILMLMMMTTTIYFRKSIGLSSNRGWLQWPRPPSDILVMMERHWGAHFKV